VGSGALEQASQKR